MSEVQPEGQPQPGPDPEDQAPEPEVEYAQIPAAEWQAMQETLQQLGPLAEYAQQMQQQQPDPYQQQPAQIEWDPFADNALDAVRQVVREEMGPIASYTQEQQFAEANEQAADILGDYLKSSGKEFLDDGNGSAEKAQEQVLIRANHYVVEEAQRYGEGLQAAEAAIQRAADEQIAYEQAVGAAYHEQQVDQVQRVTGAPQQPQTAGAQAAQMLVTPGGPDAVFQKYFGTGS